MIDSDLFDRGIPPSADRSILQEGVDYPAYPIEGDYQYNRENSAYLPATAINQGAAPSYYGNDYYDGGKGDWNAIASIFDMPAGDKEAEWDSDITDMSADEADLWAAALTGDSGGDTELSGPDSYNEMAGGPAWNTPADILPDTMTPPPLGNVYDEIEAEKARADSNKTIKGILIGAGALAAAWWLFYKK